MSIARYELCSYFGTMFEYSSCMIFSLSCMINVDHGLYHDPYTVRLHNATYDIPFLTRYCRKESFMNQFEHFLNQFFISITLHCEKGGGIDEELRDQNLRQQILEVLQDDPFHQAGETAILNCSFYLHSDHIYSVKWYKVNSFLYSCSYWS